jgi:uncharacterized membrane protein YqaE (UPF0057 family)
MPFQLFFGKDKDLLPIGPKFPIFDCKSLSMSIGRALLAVFFPPLAVYDRGCGSMLIVFLLTLCGWVPGVIAALIILNKSNY